MVIYNSTHTHTQVHVRFHDLRGNGLSLWCNPQSRGGEATRCADALWEKWRVSTRARRDLNARRIISFKMVSQRCKSQHKISYAINMLPFPSVIYSCFQPIR